MINTFSYRPSPHACSSVGHQPPGYFRPPCRSHLSTVAVETTTSSRYAIPEKDIHRHYFASVTKVSEATIGKSPGLVCRARRRSNYDDDNDSDDDEDDIDGDFHDYDEDDNDSGLSLDDLVGLDADAETSKELKEKFLVWSEYMGSNVVSTPLSEMEGQEPDPASSIFDQSSKLRELKALAQNRNGSPLQGMETDPLFPSSESFQRALETSTSMQFLFRDKLPFRADPGSLTEWDLRAAMEKKRQMKREREQWLEENARNIGRYAPVASDWRTDVRITETGNLYHPEYREWTLEEIWDLITLGGKIVDPRQVPHEVSQLDARVDFVAEGFVQEPEIPEWLDQQGKLLKEEDEGDVLDKEAEEALLASEFSDFENFGSTDSYSDSIDEPFVDDF